MNNNLVCLNNKYVVIRTINNSFGRATYLARNLNTGSRVMIKSFSFGSSENKWNSFNQIENEIKILKSLNHPQIPKYLDSFESGNSFYLVQEFINGKTLSTQKVYLEKEVIDIAKQILSILVYLQGLNPPLVHHDIKPENLLLDKKEKVYLVDFGISKEIKGETIGVTTLSGTEGFIAPERILGRKSDVRSDLYSLGITLSCLITKTPTSRAVSLLNDGFELRNGVLDCGDRLSDWIKKLVKRKPNDRFQNAAVALVQLQQISSSHPVERVKKKVLKARDKKRAIEINKTKYIQESFIPLTFILIASSSIFFLPPIILFNLCNIDTIFNINNGECTISLTNMIAGGLLGYLPGGILNKSLSGLINSAFDSLSYFFSFLIVSISMIEIFKSIIDNKYYRLKNIFLRCLLSLYNLSILFVFKTYLIGYFPVSWLVR